MRVDVNIYAIPQKADAVNIYTLSNLYFLVIVSFMFGGVRYINFGARTEINSNGQFPF